MSCCTENGKCAMVLVLSFGTISASNFQLCGHCQEFFVISTCRNKILVIYELFLATLRVDWISGKCKFCSPTHLSDLYGRSSSLPNPARTERNVLMRPSHIPPM